MLAFFLLIEKLISLGKPTLLLLQQLLAVNLTPVANSNTHFHFYEAKPNSGIIESVDYREPYSQPTKAFLVLNLQPSQLKLQDFQKRYGDPKISDLSAHHPTFIGYTFKINGKSLFVNAEAKTGMVLSVSIDYAQASIKGNYETK